MNRILVSLTWLAVGLSCVALCGCSGGPKRPPMAKVHGTVKYKGSPVADAIVTFEMEGMPRSAGGVTDANGNFKLTTFDTNDGAFVGTHKVTVSKVSKNTLGKAPESMTADDLLKLTQEGKLKEMSDGEKGAIPAKYKDLSTTPLKYTIDAGIDNEKNIDLED